MTRYYTLKFNGSVLKNREDDLIVGQCADADLRLPSDSFWEDENFFAIRYWKESDSWFAVRISDNVEISINGRPLGLADRLENGNIIQVGDSTLKFNILQDSAYKGGDGIVMSSSRFRNLNIVALSAIAVLTVAVGIMAYVQNKEKNVKFWNLSERELSSVKKLCVESIYLQKFDGEKFKNLDSIPSYNASGTCFITDAGVLITARHCIQPWLELNPLDSTALDSVQLRLVKLAMDVETSRIVDCDSALRLVVKLSIDKGSRILWSYDFRYNDERDIIVNNGTRIEPRLWRSILPSFHKRNNELGDIAWMENCGIEGDLKLAGEEQIESLAVNEQLDILGFATDDSSAEVEEKCRNNPGILVRLPRKDENGADCSCFFHDDSASKGDSGGPVLIRRGRDFYVISVLSRKDKYRGFLSGWSVPVSEIRNEK